MREKYRIGRCVERAMDLPGGILSKTAMLEIEENRRLVITGCRGIVTYTEDSICLRTSERLVTIYGCDLEMGCLSEDGAVVVGVIQRIEFTSEG